MSGILETLGLKKQLYLTINMEKSEFTKVLQSKLKPNRFFLFDILDGEKKEFYGKLGLDKFWIRKKSQKIFPESPFASARGKIKKTSNKTELEMIIIGWNWFVIFWLSGITLILGLTLNDIIRTKSYSILIILVPLFLILYSLGIYKMKKGVKKLQNHIINELT